MSETTTKPIGKSFADWEAEFPERVLVPARLCPVCYGRFIRHDAAMCLPCQQVRECEDQSCNCHVEMNR